MVQTLEFKNFKSGNFHLDTFSFSQSQSIDAAIVLEDEQEEAGEILWVSVE